MAFVFDAHSRRILGWRAATTMTTALVLDALEMAIWARARQGVPDSSDSSRRCDGQASRSFRRNDVVCGYG
jgi:transposase InsO family protein